MVSSGSTGHTERLTDLLVACAAIVGVAAYLVHEIYSLDIWWQVAIGRDILHGLTLPRVDRYTVLGLGRAYHDSHWLFQVGMAAGHAAAGWIGVQALMVAAWGGALILCYRSCRRWAGPLPSAVAVFLAAMASVERFLPRPEVVTFLMIAAFLHLLQEGRHRSPTQLAVLAALQAVWTNSHGLFVIGPFMVGCHLLAGVLGWKGSSSRPPDRRSLGVALLVVLAATIATPWGPGSWRYAALLAQEAGSGGPGVFRTLGELSPILGPGFRASPAFWLFAVLLVAAGSGALRQLVLRRTSPRSLVVLALAVAASTGRRNVVLFALVAAPFVLETWGDALEGFRSLHRPAAKMGTAALMLAAAWYPVSGRFWVDLELPARTGLGVTPSFFPHPLPSFLDTIGFRGPVLNSNTLGGFYLFHGYPERLPLTDGRWELYDPRELEWVLASSRDGSAWKAVVDRFGIEGILLAHSSPEAKALLPPLRGDPGWRLVYYDRAASFWMASAEGRGPPELDLGDPRTLPAVERVDDGLILNAFLGLTGASELQRLNLERSLAFGRRRALILGDLGRVELELGRFGEAEATFEALLEADPRSLEALNQLAFLAYRRGELEAALAWLDRALAVEPGNRDVLANRDRVREALRRRR